LLSQLYGPSSRSRDIFGVRRLALNKAGLELDSGPRHPAIENMARLGVVPSSMRRIVLGKNIFPFWLSVLFTHSDLVSSSTNIRAFSMFAISSIFPFRKHSMIRSSF
jgi:hypothetical protein